MSFLRLENVTASYGVSQALFGVSLELNEGEVVAMMGRNGMGKTTTVRSIMGMTPTRAGKITFHGQETTGLPSHKIGKSGIALVPEGRHIFPNLTTRENLVATADNRNNSAQPWDLSRVFDLFPRLKERQDNMGNQLSGGEQQMLAIGRALMTNPKLLILDEATEGLAPVIREEIWACLKQLKAEKQSILLIDKNLTALLEIGDRHNIIEKGRNVWSGSSQELKADKNAQQQFLGI